MLKKRNLPNYLPITEGKIGGGITFAYTLVLCRINISYYLPIFVRKMIHSFRV